MQKVLDFHNTIEATGKELSKYRGRAKSRQTEIFEFLKANSPKQFTPWEIYDALYSNKPTDEITSIRRSCTNLEKAEPKLIKRTDHTVMERRGTPNHKYYY